MENRRLECTLFILFKLLVEWNEGMEIHDRSNDWANYVNIGVHWVHVSWECLYMCEKI